MFCLYCMQRYTWKTFQSRVHLWGIVKKSFHNGLDISPSNSECSSRYYVCFHLSLSRQISDLKNRVPFKRFLVLVALPFVIAACNVSCCICCCYELDRRVLLLWWWWCGGDDVCGDDNGRRNTRSISWYKYINITLTLLIYKNLHFGN